MPRIRNGSMLVGAMFIAGMGLFSAVANAQNVETAPPAAPQQAPSVESAVTGAPVKADDETTAAFLSRVNTTNPDTVSIAAAELFKQSPTQGMIRDLVTIASSADAATADVTGKVTSGFPIIAVSTSAAQFSEQLSSLILSDSGQLPTIVALAQKVGNKDFSEVVGEGLALAHTTAMRNGNSILAAADRRSRFLAGKRQQHRRFGNGRCRRRHRTGGWRKPAGWPRQIAFNRQHQHDDEHKSRLSLALSPFPEGRLLPVL
nr:hypothetical protein [Agrobacterium tumefaciens]